MQLPAIHTPFPPLKEIGYVRVPTPHLHRHSYLSFLLDFADLAVVDVNILLTHTVHGGCFVNDDLFNQRIQKLRGQFGGVGILFEKLNPSFRIDSCLLFRFKLGR